MERCSPLNNHQEYPLPKLKQQGKDIVRFSYESRVKKNLKIVGAEPTTAPILRSCWGIATIEFLEFLYVVRKDMPQFNAKTKQIKKNSIYVLIV